FYDVTHDVPLGQHAGERNRQLTAAALAYRLTGNCDYALKSVEGNSAGRSAVLLTMTSREDKLWPEERWIELARALGMPAVLPWGSAAERARAERIAKAAGEATVPPRMPLGELARLFAQATAVVGLDTGLTHLAAALGVPTLGIYCGSDPALTGLYGSARARNVGAAGRPPGVADVLKAMP
ncbi:MAG: lipopolysaccharide heptosyltransferase 1, partial [Pseudomonadota bacterium]|nr:lipopolysaccharide heptosyltransferase 1 [Pseudomonadota bacterium]